MVISLKECVRSQKDSCRMGADFNLFLGDNLQQ